MDNKNKPQGRNTSPAPTGRRPRAPTITIDTSAVNPGQEMDAAPDNADARMGHDHSPTDRRSVSFDDLRPTSPHNVSSPTRLGNGHDFLAVPSQRSRGNSVDTDNGSTSSFGSETYVATPSGSGKSNGASTTTKEIIGDKDALKPDPGTEDTFEVANNNFAFSPGQLTKMFSPKSLAAFHALGGLAGIEKGLMTDRRWGLAFNERKLDGSVSFGDATSPSDSHPDSYKLYFEDSTQWERDLETRKEEGSSAGTFEDRIRVFRDNRLPERKAKSFWRLVWITYNDKVLILLTAAAVISLALGLYQTFGPTTEEGARVEWVEGVAIIVAIAIVVFVGAFNDWQKERQFVKLNKVKEDRRVSVIRSRQQMEISIYDLVVGDVLLLKQGDLVHVDGLFIDGHELKADESSATGESDMLKKIPADRAFKAIEEHQDLKKIDPFILSGSKITEGDGSMIVTCVGVNSQHGKTMMNLRDEGEITPLQSKLNILAEYIAKLGGSAGLLLFFVLLFKFCGQLPGDNRPPTEKAQTFLQILIVAVTIIVVAVPEGLPLAVTLALAFATRRMLKDNNLVRLLRSCEVMGNATTICSDKTGTLTTNKMTVVALKMANGEGFERAPPGEEALPKNQSYISTSPNSVFGRLYQAIIHCSTSTWGEDSDKNVGFQGSKTEAALLQYGVDAYGINPEKLALLREEEDYAAFWPFDSSRKCMAVVIRNKGSEKAAPYSMYVKGASEIMLARAKKVWGGEAFTSELRQKFEHEIATMADQALRTIGFLHCDFESWPPANVKHVEDNPDVIDMNSVFEMHEMIYDGVCGIQDPLRDGVVKAVQDCKTAHVVVRMVTGDNVATARAIALSCNILSETDDQSVAVMEGPEFRKMSKPQMLAAIPKLRVLARSSPTDKQTLVKRLLELGEIVAVTGDGTNDAPALKAADVGFSMGIAGTEVAKEASDIILMDDNFASIIKALLWGRTVNDAVKKFLQFQITVNITAVLLTFISAVASDEEASVLGAVQLLWVNLIMDTFAALALATDPPNDSMLDRPPEDRKASLITPRMWKMIIGQSIYQLIVTLTLHFAGSSIFGYGMDEHSQEVQSTLVFNTFVWMQIFNEINNRRLDNKYNIFQGLDKNWLFIAINCIMVGGQVMIIFVGGRAFQVTRIGGREWGVSIVLGLLSIPVGALIRTIPDPWTVKLFYIIFPAPVRRILNKTFHRKKKPRIEEPDEETGGFQWTEGPKHIRDDLSFLRKWRGGRLTQIKMAVTHPKTVIMRSRSHSRLGSRQSLAPTTPTDNQQQRPEESPAPPSQTTPEKQKRKKAGRSRSSSAIGAALAAAGTAAGSIGAWSPHAGDVDNESLKFRRDEEAAEGPVTSTHKGKSDAN
ncbi:hypothetical protein LTS18_012600 [Coniosporium uncinatum]|uniref:Uncharacterized protein n=1 Tax=Coniosporium uncinatum TaxID=93489 RepID=A0ACC3DZC0_9PEZI|nr:hypothetical protein LTS18_012600 [Coniosporium uncinatum]